MEETENPKQSRLVFILIMMIHFVHHPSIESFYGAKRSIGARVHISWTVGAKKCSRHVRKFICREGRFISTKNLKIQSGWLYFWGEYEVGSEAEIVSLHKSPKGIHDVLSKATTAPIPSNALNTDPYVFGNAFHYICCQMPMTLEKDDVVLFGNLHQGKFYFDTVFVCETKRNVSTASKGSEYYCASIQPIKAPPKSFFEGRMYKPGQSMQIPFSFVPCLTSTTRGDYKVFSFAQRPFVTALQMEFNPAAYQRTSPVPFTPEKWQFILDAVKNFSLGVHIHKI